MNLSVQDCGKGVYCIDTGQHRPRMAACYLIVDHGEAAFIDNGVNANVPGLLAVLEQFQVPRDAVRYVIPTHVHLDHAGATGALMAELPQATMLTHPRGLPHMVDPARLEAGARAVYGDDEFDRLYGTLVPVEESRARAIGHEDSITLGHRRLLALDTPGHARHHVCLYDSHAGGVFTGDTFGIRYPDCSGENGQFLFPPTTPVQFDPEAWLKSLDIIVNTRAGHAYLTHFGVCDNVAERASVLRERILEYRDLALAQRGADGGSEALKTALRRSMERALNAVGRTLSAEQFDHLLGVDLDLNTQGLMVWLERQHT